MMILNNPSCELRIKLSGSPDVEFDWTIGCTENSSFASYQGTTNGTSLTAMVSGVQGVSRSPLFGKTSISHLTVLNTDSTSKTVYIISFDGTTSTNEALVILQPQYTLHYDESWYVTDDQGSMSTTVVSTSAITIGDTVIGGTSTAFLYTDVSGNLANSVFKQVSGDLVFPASTNIAVDTLSGTYFDFGSGTSLDITTDGNLGAQSGISLDSVNAGFFNSVGDMELLATNAVIQHNTKIVIDSPIYNFPSLTASRIAITDSSQNLISADTATYPSLLEFSYVKGVTSSVQTQLGNKQPADADLTAIAALSGSSGFLKTNGAGVWSVDGSTYLTTAAAAAAYQPLDSDLTAIAALTGTVGLLRTNGAGTWSVDTSAYVTSAVTAVSGTANRITSTGGATPIVDISSTFEGLLLKKDGSIALTGNWAAGSFYISNSQIGIGTGSTTPSSVFHVVETSVSTPRGVLLDQYNTGTQGFRLTSRKARGTFISPLVIVTGDSLASWTASAHDGTNFIDSGKILITSTGTIGTGIIPSTMSLQTMTSAGVLTTGLLVDSSQHITVEGVTSTGATGTGNFVFGTSPTLKTNFKLNNPANTFAYTFTPSAIGANYNLTLPLQTQNETLAVVPTIASSTSSNPTGTASTAARVMMGIALSFTPKVSGRAFVFARGDGANSLINDGGTVVLRFGTGTAPVNGAASTGTAIGAIGTFTSFANAVKSSWTLMYPVSGLTVGTAYWFDIALVATTAGTATISSVDYFAIEM